MYDLRDLERILKPLANKRRLAALRYIKRREEVTVSDIATELKISIQAASRHLQQLARADIIESEQRSLSVYYSLSKKQRQSVAAFIALL